MVFSPSFLLLALLDSAPSMTRFDAYLLLHPFLGACAITALAARRGLSFWPVVLAGLVFMLGGPAVGRLQHVGQIVSYAMLPIALLTLERALDKPTLLRAALFGATAAVMALGRDQVAYLGCLILIAYALYVWLTSAAPLAWLVKRLPALAVAGLAGAAVLVVPLLLTLQFAAISNRPNETFTAAATGSYSPFNLLTMLMPDVLGSLEKWNLYWGPGTKYWSDANWTDRSINYSFIGTVPLALFLGVAVAQGQAFARETRFMGALALALFVYALGAFTPVFKLLYLFVPGVDLYRRPADANFPLLTPLALLVGTSAQAVMNGPTRSSPLARFAVLGMGLFVAFALVAMFNHAPDAARVTIALTAIARTMLTLAGVYLFWRLWQARMHWHPALAALAVLFTAAELVLTHCGRPLNAEPRSLYAILDDQRPSLDRDVMQQVKSLIQQEQDNGRRPRVEILGPENGWQNAAMMYGVEDTLGYNPLRIAPYERATGASETAHEPKLRPFPRSFRGYRSRLARLLGIEFLIFDTPFRRMPTGLMREKLAILREGPPYWVYRLPPAQPRAMLAARVRRTDTQEALASGEIPDFDLDTEALIEPEAVVEDIPDADGTPTEAVPGRIAIAEYSLNRVKLVAETDAPALVVLHDIIYPGWEVRVDGERKPLLRANLLFRGVAIAPEATKSNLNSGRFRRKTCCLSSASVRISAGPAHWRPSTRAPRREPATLHRVTFRPPAPDAAPLHRGRRSSQRC